jgi:hypothetical protein
VQYLHAQAVQDHRDRPYEVSAGGVSTSVSMIETLGFGSRQAAPGFNMMPDYLFRIYWSCLKYSRASKKIKRVIKYYLLFYKNSLHLFLKNLTLTSSTLLLR